MIDNIDNESPCVGHMGAGAEMKVKKRAGSRNLPFTNNFNKMLYYIAV
jgi:hypothetical protein